MFFQAVVNTIILMSLVWLVAFNSIVGFKNLTGNETTRDSFIGFIAMTSAGALFGVLAFFALNVGA